MPPIRNGRMRSQDETIALKKLLAFLILIAIAGGAYYYTRVYLPTTAGTQEAGGGGRRGGGGRGEGPVAVIAAVAKRADVPVTIDAIGTVQALNTVTVRAQVDGKLVKVAFMDGQDVKAGDILGIIDPTTFQASYDQAVAKKAQDEAQLANARIDLDRYERLAKTEYGSRQQADTQRAMVAQQEALVRSDQAAIDNAKAILDYTTIRAPLDGRTGIRAVDQGNIIKASDANGLVVITQLRPISVIFNLPQQRLRQVSEAMAQAPVVVQAFDSDNTTKLDDGTVGVVDNQVDQTTGTVRFKATFPNAKLQLWPGQFVNVKLLVRTLKDAIVVPTSAVQRGPTGPFVYIVGEDSKVALKTIKVGQQDETQSVITEGVEPPQRVVTTGFTRLTDGATVSVTTPEEDAAVKAQPPRSRDETRQRRRQSSDRSDGRDGERSGRRRQNADASDGQRPPTRTPATEDQPGAGSQPGAQVPTPQGGEQGTSAARDRPQGPTR